MPTLAAVLSTLVDKDRITASDVIAVRRAIYPDMSISRDEAEALFTINDKAGSTGMEWRQLFVEALTDYVVRQQKPSGYINGALARWLCDRITRDGRIKTETELDLLIHVLETAAQAPGMLADLALEQVCAYALTPERKAGDGPTLTAEEVRRIRSLLYAIAGDGEPAALSRREAEILFRLNEAARGRPNHPSWRELFVQAIGASLLAAPIHGRQAPEEAMRLQAWVEAPGEGVGAFLSKLSPTNFTQGWASLREESAAGLDDRRDQAAIADAERLTDDEAAWLIGRIGRDGRFDDNEIALLQFVAREASALSPALQGLVARARAQVNLAAGLGESKVFGRRA